MSIFHLSIKFCSKQDSLSHLKNCFLFNRFNHKRWEKIIKCIYCLHVVVIRQNWHQNIHMKQQLKGIC